MALPAVSRSPPACSRSRRRVLPRPMRRTVGPLLAPPPAAAPATERPTTSLTASMTDASPCCTARSVQARSSWVPTIPVTRPPERLKPPTVRRPSVDRCSPARVTACVHPAAVRRSSPGPPIRALPVGRGQGGARALHHRQRRRCRQPPTGAPLQLHEPAAGLRERRPPLGFESRGVDHVEQGPQLV